MSKARVIVHESDTAEGARRAVLALLAMGLDAEAHRVHLHVYAAAERETGDAGDAPPGHAFPSGLRTLWQVSVAEEEAAAAEAVVADFVHSPDLPALPLPVSPVFGPAADGGIWTLENASGSLSIAAACLAVHLVVHGLGEPATRSAMLDAGAVAPWMVREGQWWRLLTAAFLHFDFKHLVGNLSALLFLGPPLAISLGQLRMVALFVLTALAGNLASQLIGDEVAVKAGASGGICGLLGALAGVAIAAMASASDARERRPAWQTLGALVALFGMMVGFHPGSDHYAHVGGLLSGLALGRVMAPRKSSSQEEPAALTRTEEAA